MSYLRGWRAPVARTQQEDDEFEAKMDVDPNKLEEALDSPMFDISVSIGHWPMVSRAFKFAS